MRRLDISPAQTRAIVKRAGCRVLEGIDLYDGGRAFEIDCGNHANKVELLSALAEADADLPDVRRIAEDVTAGARTDRERAERLHGFVKSHVAFVKEKRETFSPTLRTLEIGMGDCDDSARALMALLRSLDMPSRLETLPSRASGIPPLHVAAQVKLGNGWEWLETSVDARAGEHPLRAAKRLGIKARPELGELGELEKFDATLWALGLLGAVGVLWWLARK